jgi:hypothetical protein
MKKLNFISKSMILGIVVMSIYGCSSNDSKGTWSPYSWDTEKNRFYYWILGDEYPTYDKCIKAAKFINSRPNSSKTSSEPLGCGFQTDSYFEAIINYHIYAEKEHIECIFESFNPDVSKPYGMLLKGYEITKGVGECVW